jgi:long-chain fatty acid transport protein
MKSAAANALAITLALAAAPSDLNAAGFAIYVQGVSGIGNAYAGAAAAPEDATTVWWNPAGMAWLPQGKHLAGSLAFISPSAKFSDAGSSAPPGRPLGDTTDDAGHRARIPNVFFVMDLAPQWHFGLGVSSPFGLKTEYEPTWLGRFQGITSELKTVNFNPSVAYRASAATSVGLGLNYMRGEIDFLSAVNLGAAEAQNRTTLEGDAWGFNVGAITRITPALRLGVHYRSSLKFNLDGDTAFTAPAPSSLNGKVKLDADTPDTVAFSSAYRVGEDVELLADATWWHWSKVDRLPIIRTDGSAAGSTFDTIILDFKDTWRLSAGANWKLGGPWALKAGIAYDQAPVRRPETRTVRLPDSDRYWLTGGLQYRASMKSVVDVAYSFVKAKDADIANDQSSANRGIVRGTYKAAVHTIGVQYQHSF